MHGRSPPPRWSPGEPWQPAAARARHRRAADTRDENGVRSGVRDCRDATLILDAERRPHRASTTGSPAATTCDNGVDPHVRPHRHHLDSIIAARRLERSISAILDIHDLAIADESAPTRPRHRRDHGRRGASAGGRIAAPT